LEKQKLAAALVLLSPFIPLIFMGEEYGETAPFLYFVSHSDPDLIDAVRSGRRQEFADFDWSQDPPDPQDPATFEQSRLDPSLATRDRHQALLNWHRELARLRAACPALSNLSKRAMTVHCDPSQRLMLVRRSHETAAALSLFTFGEAAGPVRIHPPAGSWRKRIDSAEARWMGPGSAVADRMHADGPIEIPTAAHGVVLWTDDNAAAGRTPQEEEPP
jgi:maltooligosyltrehalose trehalohydrolase